MEDKILALFDQKQNWTLNEIEAALNLRSTEAFVQLVKTLNVLEDKHILLNNHHHYMRMDANQYLVGKLKDISRFEWMLSDGVQKIYLPKHKNEGLFVDDLVLVDIQTKKVVRVYEHTIHQLTGTMVRRKKQLVFHSDIDYHCEFQLKTMDHSLRPGTKVVAQLTNYARPVEIKISEIIGNEKDPGVDITSMLYANKVRMHFNEKVQKELKKIPHEVRDQDRENRVDLRSLITFTIDGDDAKDFDDAISIERKPSGYRLYVHIADVSHYVQTKSAIDREAFARSTSIYVCDRVIPMLPFDLSNGICSLNPNVDRCTLTVQMEIDATGHCTSYKIYPSLIHSNQRCTYKKVNQLLEGNVVSEYARIRNQLFDLEACAYLLENQAKERGAIQFETKEPAIVLNDKGKAVDVYEKTRGYAEEMIEQCMILANVCVANCLHQAHLPCMYRVHLKPNPEKASTINTMALALHLSYDIMPDEIEPKVLAQFLSSLEENEAYPIISMISLRAMEKAYYDADCLGHFGLALEEYCHFTSPIRRYSDLVVHRMLRKYLFEKQDREQVSKDIHAIGQQAEHVSEKEREAIAIERLVNDYKKAEYMQKNIGRVYTGMISGVQKFGFFVELSNTIEGLVPVHTLMDDFYIFDEDTLTLQARSQKKAYQLGQKVRVVCTGVDVPKGHVEFALITSQNGKKH